MPRPAYESRLRNLEPKNPVNVNHYIGFDVHKKTINYRSWSIWCGKALQRLREGYSSG
jgi:hypothetical protein